MPRFVVWVSEIDLRLSRGYGRLVPKSQAVSYPKEHEVFEALAQLGVRVLERHPEKLNPRLAGLEEDLRSRGCFLVDSERGKGKTLRMVAQKVREMRNREERGRKRRKKKKRR